jgi:D-alanyl-D-alanine carboxypeptidase (penicillin-binding protein 5/6)
LHFASPIPQKQDAFDNVQPKLEQKENSYQVKKEHTLVQTAGAAANYDNASAYAVIDFTSGNVITEKNLSEQLPIASLTKIMTAVVALDLASLSDEFTASDIAARVEPTRMGVRPGDKLTLDELLHGLLLYSANDAAQVIKEGVDQKYGDSVFIHAMNEKAAFIGLRNTHFVNPQGYDDVEHYSTAEDLATLSHYALANYPQIAEIVKEDGTTIPATANHKEFKLYNWNGLIGVYPRVTGIKIGNTDAAKKTTVVLSERLGKKILVVLLGAPGILERDLWAAQLLDEGYRQTIDLPPVNVTEDDLRAKYGTWLY